MAQTLNKKLFMYFEAYKKWITQNPQLIADIESTVKCLSFFTAGELPIMLLHIFHLYL